MISGDTIVAPATPFGVGGLAVVRLSGPRARKISGRILGSTDLPAPRLATLATLKDADGNPFEEAVVTFFKTPHSYTGEDVIEFSCHGSPLIVQKIVDVCCAFGARVAEPGEFTRRAFLNGKMDLIQAESVAALIHAQSVESSRLNYRLLQGALSRRFQKLRQGIIDILSQVEFQLDISETDLLPDWPEKLRGAVASLREQTEALIASYHQGRLLTEGALVVLAGAPNVGKSTLLNTLSQRERAITSQIPGTTRDPIDVALCLDGVPIRLVDTAGLRETTGEIEREGVRRTQRYIRDADLLICMLDPEDRQDTPFQLPTDKAVVNLINKIDLCSREERQALRRRYPDHLQVSAKTGEGIDALKTAIRDALGLSGTFTENVALTTARQVAAARKCQDGLRGASEQLQQEPCAYELVAIELQEALAGIDQVLGKTTPDDILNNIFSTFCVGK
jgi:tRNA modification GTPase